MKIRIYEWQPNVCDVLGPGHRAVVWVQGCSLHCEGCIAPEMWDKGDGVDVDDFARQLVSSGPIDGVIVSGGEPSEQAEAVGALLMGGTIRG